MLCAFAAIGAFAVNDLLYRFLGGQLSPWVTMLAVSCSLFVVSAFGLSFARQKLFPRQLGGPVALLTFFRVTNSALAVFTFQLLPVSQAYLLIFTFPVLIVLFQGVFYRHFRWGSALACVLALIGLGLVFEARGFSSIPGVVVGLLCAATIAGQILAARKVADVPVLQLSAYYAVWVALAACVGLVLLPPADPVVPTQWPSWGWPLFALIFVNPLGSLAYVYAAQKLSSAHYAFLSYLQIPLAVFLAWVFLHEPVSTRVAVGLVLITAGSVVAQNFPMTSIPPRRGR